MALRIPLYLKIVGYVYFILKGPGCVNFLKGQLKDLLCCSSGGQKAKMGHCGCVPGFPALGPMSMWPLYGYHWIDRSSVCLPFPLTICNPSEMLVVENGCMSCVYCTAL